MYCMGFPWQLPWTQEQLAFQFHYQVSICLTVFIQLGCHELTILSHQHRHYWYLLLPPHGLIGCPTLTSILPMCTSCTCAQQMLTGQHLCWFWLMLQHSHFCLERVLMSCFPDFIQNFGTHNSGIISSALISKNFYLRFWYGNHTCTEQPFKCQKQPYCLELQRLVVYLL